MLKVQSEVSTVSDDLDCHVICPSVGPLCFLKSTVNAAIYQEILEHFMLLLTSFMEMLISFSSRTWHLPTLTKVPKNHGVTVLDCHRESMGYCQEEDERQQTQQCR